MPDANNPDRFAELEARLSRIEAHLGLSDAREPAPAPVSLSSTSPVTAPAAAAVPTPMPQEADELELEVGQNWFALVGILVLAVGGGFMLTLPYPGLPAAVPALAGLVAAGAIFFIAHTWENSFELVAGHLRGAGMALLYCATLRFFFFGTPPALSIGSPLAPVLLSVAVAVNAAIALRRNSPWLTTLALITGCSSALAVGSAGWVLASLTVLTAFAVFVSWRRQWPAVALASLGGIFATYALWAAGNPVRGGAFRITAEPAAAPACLLLFALAFSLLSLGRPKDEEENAPMIIGGLLTCGVGYGLFLVHTYAAFAHRFALANLGAFAVFLGLAVAFWLRRQCPISTFFNAMTAYAALSVAIIKWSAVPAVFVLLSLQSLLVVTTAIWFRSRAIVVANFLIYLAVVLAYVFVPHTETGISLGFGIVALLSARILNWKKHRLTLKTELMRNAYLLSAFIVFPYALYHLVPAQAAGLAWIGMAAVYYVLNFVVRNQKYRWMGHGTLLLTAVHLVVAGGRQLEPAWRVASFLVLGAALLIVSLTFTRLRRRELKSA